MRVGGVGAEAFFHEALSNAGLSREVRKGVHDDGRPSSHISQRVSLNRGARFLFPEWPAATGVSSGWCGVGQETAAVTASAYVAATQKTSEAVAVAVAERWRRY